MIEITYRKAVATWRAIVMKEARRYNNWKINVVKVGKKFNKKWGTLTYLIIRTHALTSTEMYIYVRYVKSIAKI